RKRWLTIGIISTAVILGVFLLIFNLPGGPLDGLRKSPVIGRYGLLLDAESNSALVRKYIWQGAADLVAPHEPLEFPDGSKDPFNALRILIGYGPESMYVAYNPFYVPELAQVERRNASPDRSHNESWDALVITGVTGLLTYLALFSLIFYYGLKWVGLITNQNQRNLFLVLMLGGGIVGALGFGFWRGVEYFGVGLPFGMLIGFLAYLTSTALFSRVDQIPGGGKIFYAITLIGVIAGIVSHFVEINFGIAIASTRIYFWVYTALLVCVGYFIPKYHETDSNVDQDSLGEIIQPRKKRRSKSAARLDREDYGRSIQDWFPAAFIIAITMIGLGYDFITNPNGLKNFYKVLWEALTRLPNRGDAISYGILAVVVTSWLMMSLVYAVEGTSEKTDKSIWRIFILTLLISGAFTLLYWIWHANSLAIIARSVASTVGGVLEQVKRYEGLITKFYIFLFFGVLVLGYSLGGSNSIKLRYVKVTSILSVTLGLIFAIFLIAYTNIRVIQADIAFKLANPFTSGDQWPIAIQIYNRANLLAPNEDYYYLFLGRAYLEYAKLIPEPVQRESLIKQAEADLREAQTINPLNTDHTANLARLYNLWSTLSPDTENRLAKAKISADYFSKAVVLSPKNARLWDEWALLYLNVLSQPAEAYERLKKAQEIDPNYHWTYALIGEYYSQQARETPVQAERNQYFRQASETYTRALELPTPGDVQAKYNYALALGAIYVQLDMSQDAIAAYKQAIELAPQNVSIWRVDEALSSLYAQVGDLENALLHINNALQLAPEDQKERLNDFLRQLQPD
ncbi:MAG TPA: hypothetical protein VLA49_16120, partial [Anaerolineales bacterium]|nr:hypothetical protein [Anaerolineales bacterium]